MCAPELKRRFTLDTLVGIIDVVDFGGIDHALLVDHNGQVIFSLDKGQVMTNLKDIYPDRALRIESGIQDATLHGQERIASFAPVNDR
jgi:methyl-accepting chemotaxis protein